MKKILSLILALILICCFGACQNNPPTPDDPSPDPHNTPQVQATYRMEEAEYSLPQKQFLVIPSHNDSRLLVIESDGSGYDPAHNNAPSSISSSRSRKPTFPAMHLMQGLWVTRSIGLGWCRMKAAKDLCIY